MIRTVAFLESGDIVLSGELSRDVVSHGVVLLTAAEAKTAARHGWVRMGEAETATQPPLYRVRR